MSVSDFSPTLITVVVDVAAAGYTSVWTPAAGKRIRLVNYTISLDGASFLSAGAGIARIGFYTAGPVFQGLEHEAYLPGAAGTTFGGWTTGQVWVSGGRGLVLPGNAALQVNIAPGALGGLGFHIVMCGHEEKWI